ncbi:hypothetical protein [Marinobacter salarius]|uniref:hypothetical protein n=1 Tax=Marinobacter salarius TaxID=1420917 RepID=UPI003D11A5EB
MVATVKPIPAASIPAMWPLLREGLASVRDKAAPDLHFDLVHDRLIASQAFLFLIPEGFFILMPLHRETPAVLIWAAYSKGRGAIRLYLPVIESLARDIGAEQLEFESDRPGYRRVFRDWQRTGQRYIRRLT